MGHRQFCNKIWQAANFTLHNLKDYTHAGSLSELIDSLTDLSGREKWILNRLNVAITTVTSSMQDYQFSGACQAAYDFWQKDFCDNYIVRGLCLCVCMCVWAVCLSVDLSPWV